MSTGKARSSSGPGSSLLIWVELSLIAIVLVAGWSGTDLRAKEKKPNRQVTGLVSDAAENPIGGATVTLTDLQTGKKTASYTGGDGKYQFSDLQLTHDYEVQATHQGVSSQVRRVSTIDPRNIITLNLQIPPPRNEE